MGRYSEAVPGTRRIGSTALQSTRIVGLIEDRSDGTKDAEEVQGAVVEQGAEAAQDAEGA